jgi:catalase
MRHRLGTGAYDWRVSQDPTQLGGPALVERTLGNMQANIGYVPGFRRAHGRGVAFRGHFTATPEAAALTIAEHMQGDEIPVTVRLSNGDGNPYAKDRSAVLGLAVRFALPSGDTSEWAALSITDFPARKPADFAGLAGAQKKNKKGKPNPLRLGFFILTHPQCLKGLLAILKAPTTESFARMSFNGLHAYFLVDADGARRAFRYRWVALAPPADLTPDERRFLPPQYLVGEMKQRVAREPAIWDLVLQMAEPGDPTDDMTKHWPDSRTTVTAGRLVVDRVHEDQDLVDRSMFDPTKVPPGIEVSSDPVLHFRSESYIESQKRRLAECKPAIKPE